jgi:hypothetical protein
VAEVSVREDRIEIALRLAVETLLAGIDQSQIADTDEAPEAEVYDQVARPAGSNFGANG